MELQKCSQNKTKNSNWPERMAGLLTPEIQTVLSIRLPGKISTICASIIFHRQKNNPLLLLLLLFTICVRLLSDLQGYIKFD